MTGRRRAVLVAALSAALTAGAAPAVAGPAGVAPAVAGSVAAGSVAAGSVAGGGFRAASSSRAAVAAGPARVVGAAAPAARLAPGENCAEPGPAQVAPSWPQAMLAPEQVWPLTRGGEVTVAILSTGVDAGRPQLRGRVLPGFDAVAGNGSADGDCTGTGTQIAGVVAAEPAGAGDVTGLAPRARILPVRVVADDPVRTAQADPAPLARGITWAVDQQADVIVAAAPVRRDDPAVRAAVRRAVGRGVVIVAAVGDLGGPDEDNPTPYPAAYPDVVGVGAVDPGGQAWTNSQRGPWVDLTAPGVAVPTLQRGGGFTEVTGTGIAAGFAGAAAALVRGKRRGLSGREIGRALIATASPTAAGPAYGAGVVNPYAAVTDRLVAPSARPLPAVQPVAPAESAGWLRRRNLALAGAGLAVAAVAAMLVMASALRRARRRRSWRPAVAAPLPAATEPPEPGPPLMLLDDPPGHPHR
jgi:hypothetical protein